MGTARMVVALAVKYLGFGETPDGSNHTIFGHWYGEVGAWCAVFVSFIFAHIVPPLLALIGGKHDYTPEFARWFSDHGRWHEPSEQMTPGDIMFFAWYGPDYEGRWKGICHVEICEGTRSDGRFVDIGGNVGDQVRRVVRSRTHLAGFGRPAYVPSAKSYRVFVGWAPKASIDAIQKAITDKAGIAKGKMRRITSGDPWKTVTGSFFGGPGDYQGVKGPYPRTEVMNKKGMFYIAFPNAGDAGGPKWGTEVQVRFRGRMLTGFVADKGPALDLHRGIDLGYPLAKALGFLSTGVGAVEYRFPGRGSGNQMLELGGRTGFGEASSTKIERLARDARPNWAPGKIRRVPV